MGRLNESPHEGGLEKTIGWIDVPGDKNIRGSDSYKVVYKIHWVPGVLFSKFRKVSMICFHNKVSFGILCFNVNILKLICILFTMEYCVENFMKSLSSIIKTLRCFRHQFNIRKCPSRFVITKRVEKWHSKFNVWWKTDELNPCTLLKTKNRWDSIGYYEKER